MGEGTTSPNTEGWRDTHRSTPYVRSIRSHAHVRCVWRWVFTLELCSAACRTMMASSGGAGERRGTEQMRLFAHNGGNTYFSTLTGWPRAAYWTAALSAARRTREASIKVRVLACSLRYRLLGIGLIVIAALLLDTVVCPAHLPGNGIRGSTSSLVPRRVLPPRLQPTRSTPSR